MKQLLKTIQIALQASGSWINLFICVLLSGSMLLLNACSDETESPSIGREGELVPLLLTSELPASSAELLQASATRAGNGTQLTANNQVVVEVEYDHMELDGARTTGVYTITLGQKSPTTGNYACTLSPYSGDPASETTKNQNTVRVPVAQKFSLRIHGMAGKGLAISHTSKDVMLNNGTLELGRLKMATAHIAIKVIGAYGEGEVTAEAFDITYNAPLYSVKEENGVYLWGDKPEGSSKDKLSGLDNPWLLLPEKTIAAQGKNSTKTNLWFTDLAAPDTIEKDLPFIVLEGASANSEGTSLQHAYIGKRYRIQTPEKLIHAAGMSYTYTVKLAQTTATIINVEVGEWLPGEEININNQPGIYTAQDFTDFAAAWNEFGVAGLAQKKYRQWVNYADTVNLMNDIHLPDNFTAIGTDDKPFTLFFNGNRHTITATGGALFGTTSDEALIQGLIRGGRITQNAGLVKTNNANIVGCINTANVKGETCGIVYDNKSDGGLYGCICTGNLETNAIGITSQNTGTLSRCYYLSKNADGTKNGENLPDIKTMNQLVPAFNSGIARYNKENTSTQNIVRYKFETGTPALLSSPRLTTGEAERTVGIFDRSDLISFANSWNKSQTVDPDIWDEGSFVYLKADIDLGEGSGFSPIGTQEKPFGSSIFSMYFYGEGHSITLKGGSIFGYIHPMVHISNIIRKGEITTNYSGGIITYNISSIEGCINKATISGKGAAGIAYSNVANNKNPNYGIIRCSNEGKISGEGAAGIVAFNGESSYIRQCLNEGEVSGKGAAGIASSAQGLIVMNVNSGRISGDGAAGCAIPSSATGSQVTIAGCINSREAVSGTNAFAICPVQQYISIDGCYYVGKESDLTGGTPVAEIKALNSDEVIGVLNSAIKKYNESNDKNIGYTKNPNENELPLLK